MDLGAQMRLDFYGRMDIFKRYYDLSKFFLAAIGQWPYESFIGKSMKRTFVILSLFSLMVATVSRFFTTEITLDLLVDVIPPLLLFMISIVKYLSYWLNSELLKTIIDRIKSEWDQLADEDEVKIFEAAAEEAKFYILNLVWLGMIGMLGFSTMQLFPSFLDLVAPLNESRPNYLLINAEYFVDQREHFYKLTTHMQIVLVVTLCVVIGTDTMTTVILIHISGMFTLTGHRLAHVFDEDSEKYYGTDKTVLFCSRIARAVHYHRSTVTFTETVADSWTIFYCVQLVLIVIILTGLLLQLHLELIKLENIQLIILDVSRVVSHFLVVFFNILPAQRIMDCSNNILNNVYAGQWYSAPLKTQKLILFVMRRAIEPCRISANSLIHMSFEIYASILELTFSYFTLIHSLRQ